MIKIENTQVWGFEGAIRGMRMPFESFDKSDSGWDSHCVLDGGYQKCDSCPWQNLKCELAYYNIGFNDMTLAKKLIKGGSEHRKFLRMIHVQAEVLAPRYWWAEMDKYKYVEANSSSTMHLITKRELTVNDFSFDTSIGSETIDYLLEAINCRIEACNKKGIDGIYVYSQEEREQYFREIKQLLPESYNQRRMIDTNYECLLNIYHQRKNHRLTEWHEFCSWVESLPYMGEFLEATK